MKKLRVIIIFTSVLLLSVIGIDAAEVIVGLGFYIPAPATQQTSSLQQGTWTYVSSDGYETIVLQFAQVGETWLGTANVTVSDPRSIFGYSPQSEGIQIGNNPPDMTFSVYVPYGGGNYRWWLASFLWQWQGNNLALTTTENGSISTLVFTN